MITDKITVEEDDRAFFMTINGDLEITTIRNFEEAMFYYVQKSDKDVELDFSRVQYLDSSGVGTLIRLSKLLKKKGKNLSLVNLPDKISRILKLSSLYEE